MSYAVRNVNSETLLYTSARPGHHKEALSRLISQGRVTEAGEYIVGERQGGIWLSLAVYKVEPRTTLVIAEAKRPSQC